MYRLVPYRKTCRLNELGDQALKVVDYVLVLALALEMSSEVVVAYGIESEMVHYGVGLQVHLATRERRGVNGILANRMPQISTILLGQSLELHLRTLRIRPPRYGLHRDPAMKDPWMRWGQVLEL